MGATADLVENQALSESRPRAPLARESGALPSAPHGYPLAWKAEVAGRLLAAEGAQWHASGAEIGYFMVRMARQSFETESSRLST